MSLFDLFKGKGSNGFGYSSTAEDVTAGLDLTGKTYMLTGCNSGIGQETARVLGLRGARVIGAARTLEKAQTACADFGPNAVPLVCELSEPSSVRAAVQTVKDLGYPLDGILCNAGIMALPNRELHHGYEAQFFTNHVGHFILVTGLLDLLADDGRVVMTSSSAHRGTYAEGVRFDDLSADNGYSAYAAYGQSKLCNILFASHLSTKMKPGQTANAIHPGVIKTNLGRHINKITRRIIFLFSPLVLKTIPQGAATQTLVATHPSTANQTGRYWVDSNPANSSNFAKDAALAEKLWTKTEQIVANLR
jgi:NAD(P)-dependent dehydrogenase (short-subunit alcohol dehydrogenase family)